MSEPSIPGPPPAPMGESSVDGLVKGLTDLTFTKFITIKFAAVIYVVGIVLAILSWLGLVIAAFNVNAGAGIAALLLGWIIPLVQIIVTRVSLELAVSLVRTAQNTSRMAEKA